MESECRWCEVKPVWGWAKANTCSASDYSSYPSVESIEWDWDHNEKVDTMD